jgi:hypothetical protein
MRQRSTEVNDNRNTNDNGTDLGMGCHDSGRTEAYRGLEFLNPKVFEKRKATGEPRPASQDNSHSQGQQALPKLGSGLP